MALFYKLPQNKSLSHEKNVNGIKISKERISIGECCNGSNSSDKVKLVVIFKSFKDT